MINWLNGAFSYIPTIIVIILFATLPPILTVSSRPFIMVVVLAVIEIGHVANLFKLEFDAIARKEFIQSGISIGSSPIRLIGKYYLPYKIS